MRVLVVGATGTIGRAAALALEGRGHEVVGAGHSGGDLRVDLSSKASIKALYDAAGSVDAVVCTAGQAQFGALADLDDAAFRVGIDSKLMGQVNLVRVGLEHVARGGSFTLTTGTLTLHPEAGTSAVSMVGAAVEAFVRSAALDLASTHRLNAVSPGFVAETRVARGMEAMPGIWASDLAAYYLRCVEGAETGQVLVAEAPLR